MNIFAERLRESRGEQSQAAFTKQFGMKVQQYSKYELGINTPSIEFVQTLCRINGCSADWLLGLPTHNNCSATVSGNGNIVATGNARVHQPLGESASCSKCPYKRRFNKIAALVNPSPASTKRSDQSQSTPESPSEAT